MIMKKIKKHKEQKHMSLNKNLNLKFINIAQKQLNLKYINQLEKNKLNENSLRENHKN